MANNDPVYFRLIQDQINVQNELIRVIKDDLEYRQKLQQKSMAEGGGLLRAKDDQTQRILSAANAVADVSPDLGTPGTRARGRQVSGRRMEEEGQFTIGSIPTNLAPDSEERTRLRDPNQQLTDEYTARVRGRAYNPSRDDPMLDVPPGYQPSSESRPLPPDARQRSGSFASDFRQERGPTQFERELEAARPPLSTLQRLRKEYSDAPGGMLGGARAALGSFASPIPPDSAGANEGGGNERGAAPAPDGTSAGGGGTTGGGGTSAGGGGTNPNDPFHMGNQDTQTAMTWAMMGEHGGPAWMRNLYLGSWQMRQGLGWGTRNTDALRNALQNPDSMASNVVGKVPGLDNIVNENTLRPLSGALNLARENAALTYVGYRALRGTGNFVSNRFAQLRDYQAMGQQFGYGGPSIGGQSMFGFHNPLGNFGTAAQVGAAMTVEQQALMGRIPGQGFGSGLSAQQAQGDVQSLAQQGFSMAPIGGGGIGGAALSAISTIPGIGGPLAGELGGLGHQLAGIPLIGKGLSGLIGGDRNPQGDIANIGQNLDRPLQSQNPGLTGEDINQFTPALRRSGTSIQQMTDALDGLGLSAHATKETVGQFAGSLSETAQTFQSLGSSFQGGTDVGKGFSNVTGMDPRVAGQLAQNPLFQGMAMSQQGILPSGLGDMSSGAFSNTALSTVQMLARGLGGINQTHYQTINGVKLPTAQGQTQMYDQIAQMTGMTSNDVKYMLQDQNHIQARGTAMQAIGDPNTNTGIFALVNQGQKLHHGKLTDQEYHTANQDWQKAVEPYLKQSGVSKKEIDRLNHMSGMRDRLKAARRDITNQTNNDPLNQIINKPNANTVQVQFTGLASKFFQQTGITANKATSNAGGPSISSIANQVVGDLSNPTKLITDIGNL